VALNGLRTPSGTVWAQLTKIEATVKFPQKREADPLAAEVAEMPWIAPPGEAPSRSNVVLDNDLIANVLNSGNVARGSGSGNFLIFGGDPTAQKNCAIDHRNFNSSDSMLSDSHVDVKF